MYVRVIPNPCTAVGKGVDMNDCAAIRQKNSYYSTEMNVWYLEECSRYAAGNGDVVSPRCQPVFDHFPPFKPTLEWKRYQLQAIHDHTFGHF